MKHLTSINMHYGPRILPLIDAPGKADTFFELGMPENDGAAQSEDGLEAMRAAVEAAMFRYLRHHRVSEARKIESYSVTLASKTIKFPATLSFVADGWVVNYQ